MKTKRKSIDEKLHLIMECRNSGLSDYQWCKRHDINPSTFYNWINRLRRQGNEIPEALLDEKKLPLKQEVVKLQLAHEDARLSEKSNGTIRTLESQTITESPAVEIVLENATIRFFNGAEQHLIETMFKCLGGVLHVG